MTKHLSSDWSGVLLLTFALPMAATAIGLMVWARAWRKRHAAKRR